jgi:hypothetical protein
MWEREVMITEKTTQWENAQFREDEINGELIQFQLQNLKGSNHIE